MMRSTLGAPLGGTTCGGHQGFESFALRLIVPPNLGGGGGRYLPSMVVVALGDPTAASCAPWVVILWPTGLLAAGRNSARRSKLLSTPWARWTLRVTTLPPAVAFR